MSESVKVILDLDSVIWQQFLDRWWSKKKDWPTLELSNYPISYLVRKKSKKIFECECLIILHPFLVINCSQITDYRRIYLNHFCKAKLF